MINELARQVHENNIKKGFYEEEKNIGEMLALIHSEVSESLECDRENRFSDKSKFIGWANMGFSDSFEEYQEKAKVSFEQNIKDTFEDELADIVIRVMDLAFFKGIDLEYHIINKMRYNSLRPYRHNKKY